MRSEGYSTLFVFLSVSVGVSDTPLQASVVKGTLKFRHQRSADYTLECFNSWILLTMLGSRDMAKYVSQEAYDRSYKQPIKTNGDVIREHAASNKNNLEVVRIA